jgi:hypothetical protein
MQNTPSGWTEEHKWCKGISTWYTFASLVFFCSPGLCLLHCFLYMIYLCITCVFLSTQIVCFALFPLDAKVYHIEGTMQNTQSGWQKNTRDAKVYHIEGTMQNTVHPDGVFCIVPSICYIFASLVYFCQPDCVFCIVSSIWYTFASRVFFFPPGLCVLHCSLYMIYLCITCVISYRGNNAKHTIQVDRKTHVMQRYII